MNLQELIKVGAAAPISYVKRPVKWEGHEFDVEVKSEMTAADFEFVYRSAVDEDSYMARRVHRFIRLKDGEQVPYADAKCFKTSLLISLCAEVNAVHGTEPEAGKQVKKPLRRTKKSGTS